MGKTITIREGVRDYKLVKILSDGSKTYRLETDISELLDYADGTFFDFTVDGDKTFKRRIWIPELELAQQVADVFHYLERIYNERTAVHTANQIHMFEHDPDKKLGKLVDITYKFIGTDMDSEVKSVQDKTVTKPELLAAIEFIKGVAEGKHHSAIPNHPDEPCRCNEDAAAKFLLSSLRR